MLKKSGDKTQSVKCLHLWQKTSISHGNSPEKELSAKRSRRLLFPTSVGGTEIREIRLVSKLNQLSLKFISRKTRPHGSLRPYSKTCMGGGMIRKVKQSLKQSQGLNWHWTLNVWLKVSWENLRSTSGNNLLKITWSNSFKTCSDKAGTYRWIKGSGACLKGEKYLNKKIHPFSFVIKKNLWWLELQYSGINN